MLPIFFIKDLGILTIALVALLTRFLVFKATDLGTLTIALVAYLTILLVLFIVCLV